jgi:hypothetical protein
VVDTRVGPNPFVVDEGVRMVLLCANCGEQASSNGSCKWDCLKRFPRDCYDCGAKVDEADVHFALDGCPGYFPCISEYVDGWENPEYRAHRREVLDAQAALAKAYDPKVRATLYKEAAVHDAKYAAWGEIVSFDPTDYSQVVEF